MSDSEEYQRPKFDTRLDANTQALVDRAVQERIDQLEGRGWRTPPGESLVAQVEGMKGSEIKARRALLVEEIERTKSVRISCELALAKMTEALR